MESVGAGYLIFLIFLLPPYLLAYCICHLRFNEKIENAFKTKTQQFCLLFMIIIWICGLLVIEKFGSKDINSIFARREFDFRGYVYAFPNKNHDKNYHLKADMRKEGSSYFVNRIYFYNGGSIEFDNDEPLNKKGKMVCDYGYDENEWCFRFYGDMVKY